MCAQYCRRGGGSEPHLDLALDDGRVEGHFGVDSAAHVGQVKVRELDVPRLLEQHILGLHTCEVSSHGIAHAKMQVLSGRACMPAHNGCALLSSDLSTASTGYAEPRSLARWTRAAHLQVPVDEAQAVQVLQCKQHLQPQAALVTTGGQAGNSRAREPDALISHAQTPSTRCSCRSCSRTPASNSTACSKPPTSVPAGHRGGGRGTGSWVQSLGPGAGGLGLTSAA